MSLLVLAITLELYCVDLKVLHDHDHVPDHLDPPHPQVCRVDMSQPAKRIHNFIRGLDSSPGAFASSAQININVINNTMIIIMIIRCLGKHQRATDKALQQQTLAWEV